MTERNTAKPEDYGYTNGAFYESMHPDYEQDHTDGYGSVDAMYKNEELGFTIRVRTVGEPETISYQGRDYQVSRIRALEVPRLSDNPTAEQLAAHAENLDKFNNDDGHLVLTSSLEHPERPTFEHRKAIIHTEDGSLQRTPSGEVLEVEVLSEPYEVGGKGKIDGRVVVKVKDSSGSGPPQIREIPLASIEIDWTRGVNTSGRASMSIHERELQEYIASLEASGHKSTADDLQRMAEGEQDYLRKIDEENIEQRTAVRDKALERASRVRTSDEALGTRMEEQAQKAFLRPENGYTEGSPAHRTAADHLRQMADERVRTNNVFVYIVEQSTEHQSRGEVGYWGLNAFDIKNRDLIDSFRTSLTRALERSETPNYIREHKTAQGDVLVDYYYKCGSDNGKPMYYIEQRDLASGRITLIGAAVLKDDSLDAKRSYHLPTIERLDREGVFKPGDHVPYRLDSLTAGILERDGVGQADIDHAMQTAKIDRRSKYQKLKAINRRWRAHSTELTDDESSDESDEVGEPLSLKVPSTEGAGESILAEATPEPATETDDRSSDDTIASSEGSAETSTEPSLDGGDEIPAGTFDGTELLPLGTSEPGQDEVSDGVESGDKGNIFYKYRKPRKAIDVIDGATVVAEGYYERGDIYGNTKKAYEIAGSPVTLPEENILLLNLLSTPVEGVWRSLSGIDRPVVVLGSYGVNPRDGAEYLEVGPMNRPIKKSEIMTGVVS